MEIEKISEEINKNNHSKGFWDEGIDIPKKLMLIVSEVSEAMEADRKGRRTPKEVYRDRDPNSYNVFSEYTTEFRNTSLFQDSIKDTFEDELADVAIRLFDLAYEMEIPLAEHIKWKHTYNTKRPHMHGKKY